MKSSSKLNLGDVKALRKEIIAPHELISELGVDQLNYFSDLYYQRMLVPECQMAKPFSMPDHAPKFFSRVGLMLEGLDLGPSMRVLDFGAGTCWLSKMLWQLGCSVVSLEVSSKALELGKQLMDYHVPYAPKSKWEPLLFDGHSIDLPDSSIDRVVMFDVFHHVPNPDEVASECFRVLRPGGILSMNEPVGAHSSTCDSQHEMRQFGVLENDLVVESLSATFINKGFSPPTFKVFADPGLEISLSDRERCLAGRVNKHIRNSIRNGMKNSAVIFFRKGERRLDSRRSEGLQHRLVLDHGSLKLRRCQVCQIRATLHNTGCSRWLADNSEDRGVVKVGTQLLDPDTSEEILDHGRWRIPHDVAPGDSLEMSIPFSIDRSGVFLVRFDLVSEHVCWFNLKGSRSVYVHAEVFD